jgi:hypothetical protein
VQQERILLRPGGRGAATAKALAECIVNVDQRRERRSDGTDPSGGLTSGRPQTGEAWSKTSRASSASALLTSSKI